MNVSRMTFFSTKLKTEVGTPRAFKILRLSVVAMVVRKLSRNLLMGEEVATLVVSKDSLGTVRSMPWTSPGLSVTTAPTSMQDAGIKHFPPPRGARGTGSVASSVWRKSLTNGYLLPWKLLWYSVLLIVPTSPTSTVMKSAWPTVSESSWTSAGLTALITRIALVTRRFSFCPGDCWEPAVNACGREGVLFPDAGEVVGKTDELPAVL
ncbi:hypothetical protein FVEG_16554 [Fusarium verticillioides 7600]|uniref:Uncharacterized protein n=1 Tax=Gibberella moniliformis (strain M3125 / FGSC 7600) TaxID=334819 RepID=W7MQR2_GIBM7|nr:hypothetical protein FVEG_16554 [Fusarium verticillioides 7600]XP_018756146.1 hypothetical protein FVEG_16554 [Fusarium verticillioides 7600]EWG49954.1 hypothetical protein FVEG_16554 [Fusarium verticillioides 7600]EWG49955.1 hypothetical protein FVEG_16554 [Fusarium verticillioides 7600]